MIKEFKAAGTVLFGKGMAAQFVLELVQLGSENPLIIYESGNLKKAKRIGKVLSSGLNREIKLMEEGGDTSAYDFLILAGGKVLTDRFRDDKRSKAHFPLCRADLLDIREPQTDFLVVEHFLIRKSEVSQQFFETYARSMTSGILQREPGQKIPSSFTFHNRTTVFIGDDSLEKLPQLLNDREISKPLLLTDNGIISVGLLEYVTGYLEGREYRLFSEIPPDSRIDVVNSIAELYVKEKCDGIIAFGGGSVLDTGKGVWLNVSLGVSDLNRMVGSGHIPSLKLPFIAIPTTSGTGSEVTKVAVVSDPEKGRKLLFNSDNLQPDFAVLDSRLTASLPPFLTSITGMDAMTHAVEAYTCLGKNPLSDHLAWSAISMISEHLKGAVEKPEDLNHRRALAAASNMAGSAFSNSMVGLVHTIGHSIGSVCHAPHGSCMSVLLAPVLKYNKSAIAEELALLLEALAGKEVYDSVDEKGRAERAIEEIENLNLRLKELTGGRHPVKLSDIVNREGESLIKASDFEKIAETALGDGSIIYNPVEARKDDILTILKAAY